MAAPGQTGPGWYPDPSGNGGQRYWDGNEWGPTAPGAPAGGYPPPQRSRRRGRGCLFMLLGAMGLVVLIVIVVVIAAASSSTPGKGSKSHPAANDVTVSSCSVDATLGLPQAAGTIVNHSSGASNYLFTISFLNSAGTVVAQGSGAENNIAPGQTASWSATGDNKASGSVTCKVVDVTRLAAG